MNVETNDKHENRQTHPAHWMSFIEASVKLQNTVAILIILAFAAINIFSVLRNYSLTTDEDKHILYGERVASGNSTRIDDSKMPVTALNMLPKKLASLLADGRIKQVLSRVYVARTVTIFFSCLLAFLIFSWSRSLYGFIPALFSLTLYVLDPNIIAHSQLVTTDLYLALAITFAFFTLWKFANERSLKNGLICLFALGIAQMAKYTAIMLYPLFLLTLLVHDSPLWLKALREKSLLKDLTLKYIKYSLAAIFASILLINLGFLFNQTFKYFGDYEFRSDVFQGLQASLPILSNFPVPVPFPYLQGLDWMRNTESTGNLAGNVYLLGQVSTLKGFPGYYFVASLLKVPIATQIILISALFVYFTQKDRRKTLLINEIFLLIPVLFYTIYFNFFFNTQIGIRYFLPVFSLLYVFSGNLFTGWGRFSFPQKAAIFALLIYLCVSVFSYYPYHMSYFNEIVWDRKQAYKYLADSNIDWSQGKNELDQYMIEHPDAVYKPGKVRSGHLVVRVNDLVGVTTDPQEYAWLRDNFEPVDTIVYSYLIYKISPEEINHLCATTRYCDQ
jgi:4-amino-4-deoxy-L-arabinose transferase-like glycosyltransferase